MDQSTLNRPMPISARDVFVSFMYFSVLFVFCFVILFFYKLLDEAKEPSHTTTFSENPALYLANTALILNLLFILAIVLTYSCLDGPFPEWALICLSILLKSSDRFLLVELVSFVVYFFYKDFKGRMKNS